MAGTISYVGSWSDELKGNNLAMTQIASGVDIIFSAAGVSGLGVISAAKISNFYVIGTDSDQRSRAPDNVLVSTLKRVDIAVFDVISNTVKGHYKSGTLMYGLKENGVGLSLDNALPVVNDQIKKKINEIQSKIISGEIVVPVQ
jgi:basic membrane protein A and related proteins